MNVLFLVFIMQLLLKVTDYRDLINLAVAGDVFDGVFLCCPFSHEKSWMNSGTELSQFLWAFISIFDDINSVQ